MLTRILRRLFPTPSPLTLSSLDAYHRWAATYPPHAHNALMQAEQAAMEQLLPPMAGKVVLDLACGTGRYGLLAQNAGAQTVIGVDNSAAMLRQNPLPFSALATTEAIPLAGEAVDVVVCGLALGHVPRLGPSLAEISRVLKPGGDVLISDFHPFIFLGGQRRTFTAPDGITYAVEHYAHLYADYHAAAQAAGLTVEHVAEPRLGEHLTARFVGETTPGTPVIIVYRMRK
jgi:malonyl-CoA O-methyltransferase